MGLDEDPITGHTDDYIAERKEIWSYKYNRWIYPCDSEYAEVKASLSKNQSKKEKNDKCLRQEPANSNVVST